MKNGIVRFGDLYKNQIRGTDVMGKPQHHHVLIYLKVSMRLNTVRDDKTTILSELWVPPLDPALTELKWLELQANVNNNHGLELESTK